MKSSHPLSGGSQVGAQSEAVDLEVVLVAVPLLLQNFLAQRLLPDGLPHNTSDPLVLPELLGSPPQQSQWEPRPHASDQESAEQ